jgi:hypothetical protein
MVSAISFRGAEIRGIKPDGIKNLLSNEPPLELMQRLRHPRTRLRGGGTAGSRLPHGGSLKKRKKEKKKIDRIPRIYTQ